MTTEAAAYRHWQGVRDRDGIVWLTFDRAERSINTLSGEVLTELDRFLDDLVRTPPVGLVIRSGKESGFIAGADVTEFGAITDRDRALPLIERGQAIMARLEGLPFPTLCLIHGFCLGGGLELALACRWRIAAATPETRLGLPEVNLGIHPGFGGTVRLTRLIGPLRALELMLTGRSVDSRKARKLGLVDYAVPVRLLENAARATILHAPSPVPPGPLTTLCNSALLRPPIAWYLKRQVARRAHRAHYPAPYALIDLWFRHGNDPAAMYRAEASSVAGLVTGPVSRNLVRLFLLRERLRAVGREGESAPRHLHVVGGGVMGGDIAAWCALQGLRVTVQDVDLARLGRVMARAAALFRKKLKEPRLVTAALDRLIPDPAGDGIPWADVVIEAIFEDADAKRALYRSIEPRLKEGAILATNTSSIPLEELAPALARPERLVGLHFFNPVARMELIEVVRGSATAPETVARAAAFAGAIGRLPLPVKSSPGFLVNRVLMPYLLEAVLMETEGIPAPAIDRAAVGFGMPVGPIALADTVGLDVCLAVARILAGHLGTAVPGRLEELVAAGRLGKKSGRGFYDYREGRAVAPDAGKGEQPPADLERRLMLRLVNEAVACLREGVTTDADLLDAGVVFGTGFAPFRGGPLRYLRSAGAAELHRELEALAARYGSRFAPDAGWGELPAGAGKA
jgi:3-hydroxyacyl-CoA dehydrogenase / enoyl-CoA hydratase / 3-hydroxybutyryl-CoA epimerase